MKTYLIITVILTSIRVLGTSYEMSKDKETSSKIASIILIAFYAYLIYYGLKLLFTYNFN